MNVLPAYMYMYHVFLFDPLELESWMVVNQHVGAGKRTYVLEEQQVLVTLSHLCGHFKFFFLFFRLWTAYFVLNPYWLEMLYVKQYN